MKVYGDGQRQCRDASVAAKLAVCMVAHLVAVIIIKD